MIYAVTVQKSDGNHEISRYFQTRKAARKWAQWCATQSWVSVSTIWNGQAGGERLEDFSTEAA